MSRNVHLHARDVQVLELLADRRIETLAALHELLWPDCTKKSAYNRLGQLAKAGYLEHLLRPEATPRASHDRRPSEHLYMLGPKAPVALRIRQRSTRRLAAAKLPAAFIDHQLAVNRVGDWLGTRLLGEHESSAGLNSRHRPDAAYRAHPDGQGRNLVLIEVDLGHYSRARILDKVTGFQGHPRARCMLFACPDGDRAQQIANWLRERLGPGAIDERCQVVTFAELRRGDHLDPGFDLLRVPTPTDTPPPDWYSDIHGTAGHQ